MKGQTINFRKPDGSWVTGYFIPEATTQVSINSRKYYNYCRNDSSSIRQAMFWDGSLDEDLNYAKMRNQYRQFSKTMKLEPKTHFEIQPRQYRNTSQYDNQYNQNDLNRKMSLNNLPIRQDAFTATAKSERINIKQYLQNQKLKEQRSNDNKKTKNFRRQQQIQSQNNAKQKVKFKSQKKDQSNQLNQKNKSLFKRKKRNEKSAQRLKIQKYIKSLVPYTRQLSNTRFRTLYDKQCLQTYGNKNVNQPIGGIIYGNHMKTFNIGPHSGDNDPQYYQTHHTALNYAKRTKLSDEQRWRKIQIQYNKKLNLRPVNQTLKQGKNIDIQQINQDNMYQVMKQNHEFAKEHKQQIRELEKQYQKQKTQAMQQQALNKKNRQKKFTNKDQPQPQKIQYDQDDLQEKLKNQVIYKFTDKDGNVRYAADRHAITCYVDLNFPQNDQVYTQQLIKRSPIFPQQVRDKDKNLDDIRRQNYIDSEQYNYPAHYLVPNVDYSKVYLGSREKSKQRRSKSRQLSNAKKRILRQGQNSNNRNNNNDPNSRNKSNSNLKATIKNDRNNINNRGNLGQQQNSLQKYKQKRNQQDQNTNNRLNRKRQNDGCVCPETNNGCTPQLKQILLQKASKDPHLASKLLSYAKKYDCSLNNNIPTKLVQNMQYDPSNYFPHAIHELNPKLYSQYPTKSIPYAGLNTGQR